MRFRIFPFVLAFGVSIAPVPGQASHAVQPLAGDSTGNASARWDELASLPMPGGYPAKASQQALYDELSFQRAVQVYLWAMPAMSLYSMRHAQELKFGTGSNVMTVWKDRPDAKTVVLTANPDVLYSFAWLDLNADGPTVVDAPPQLQGLMDDAWHRPLTDVGLAGPDQGNGGKYLVVPPGYQGELPEGYFVVRSPTNGVFVFWRGFMVKGKTEPGVASIEKTRIYPLAKKDAPPEMKFPNASGVPMDMLFPTNASYFDNVAEFIDAEPAAPEDFAMRGMAASIGIVKG
ncbi:hypothetical protein LMG27952_06607 [Paraburkholderia hiiakae]|uniref:DUF1254 domain-containing protein n=2 Tax=Paraburkholderia hiiakae TaxID=1081782 RepID=A0ABM8P7H2_9BURK|nr:hypothetical protein LMG27952_06607 [Paraburkholderia hiiakae]